MAKQRPGELASEIIDAVTTPNEEEIQEVAHPAPPAPKAVQSKDPIMVQVGKVITDEKGKKFHVKRRWKEKTPAVCLVQDCGFDALEESGAPKGTRYWDLTSEDKQSILKLMSAHAATHVFAQSDEMPASQILKSWPPPQETILPTAGAALINAQNKPVY